MREQTSFVTVFESPFFKPVRETRLNSLRYPRRAPVCVCVCVVVIVVVVDDGQLYVCRMLNTQINTNIYPDGSYGVGA